jgi:ribosomal protein S18 acetylase RimI-like enzyme
MTLVISEKGKRRMGYGTRTFHLFAQTIRRYKLIERIAVNVREDNYASISFWSGLGFVHRRGLDGIKVMSVDL